MNTKLLIVGAIAIVVGVVMAKSASGSEGGGGGGGGVPWSTECHNIQKSDMLYYAVQWTGSTTTIIDALGTTVNDVWNAQANKNGIWEDVPATEVITNGQTIRLFFCRDTVLCNFNIISTPWG